MLQKYGMSLCVSGRAPEAGKEDKKRGFSRGQRNVVGFSLPPHRGNGGIDDNAKGGGDEEKESVGGGDDLSHSHLAIPSAKPGSPTGNRLGAFIHPLRSIGQRQKAFSARRNRSGRDSRAHKVPHIHLQRGLILLLSIPSSSSSSSSSYLARSHLGPLSRLAD
jgi:hypothetical protein